MHVTTVPDLFICYPAVHAYLFLIAAAHDVNVDAFLHAGMLYCISEVHLVSGTATWYCIYPHNNIPVVCSII